ncbi:MAG: MBL fold metallo-hydrolase [Spirochaetales bacterium]|nr:MBL fold metallo-hydrolase [Spirochaetales bacterium]
MRNIKIWDVRGTDYTEWVTRPATLEALPVSRVELAWLGQAGFVIKAPGVSLSIDMYLSDSLAKKYAGKEFPHIRMAPAPVLPEALKSMDLILSTHGHTDHMDGEALEVIYKDGGAVSPVFIGPRAEMQKAGERGVPSGKFIGLTSDESYTLYKGQQGRWLKKLAAVTAIPAAHEVLDADGWGNYRALGYVIDIHGLRMYHSGDTVPYEGLSEHLRNLRIDVALLPVNGRDEYRTSRGIAGNFTLEEACSCCRDAGIPFLIPHHYGMFEFNTIDPREVDRGLESWGWQVGKDSLKTEMGFVYTIGV